MLREMTGRHYRMVAIPTLVQHLNRQVQGWAAHYRFGWYADAMRHINFYLHQRLKQHLRNRSQRPFRPPEGASYYQHFRKLGLVRL